MKMKTWVHFSICVPCRLQSVRINMLTVTRYKLTVLHLFEMTLVLAVLFGCFKVIGVFNHKLSFLYVTQE